LRTKEAIQSHGVLNSLPLKLRLVLDAQAKSGAFLSSVLLNGQVVPDENGFVTALIIHEISRYDDEPSVQEAIERGLEFLLRCEICKQPGHFSFYPEDAHPDWMGVRLPPDADDTSLFAPLLVRYGRRPPNFLSTVVEEVLDPHRQLYLAEWSQPWHRVGVFRTWLQIGFPRNVVDCCVNVNALALLKQSAIADPTGFAEIVSMIESAVEWAGNSLALARRLSPWYPHPIELVHAVERAVSVGVSELDTVLSKMQSTPWGKVPEHLAAQTPVCGSSDRQIIWTCEALQTARSLNLSLT
jgi:hypothetical protein